MVILLPSLAGEEGFEPSFTDPESAVLPLDDSPAHQNYSIQPCLEQTVFLSLWGASIFSTT